MISEKEYVISAFRKNFEKYKEQSIVIYGLGNNTKLLLETFEDYNIVGLMDAVRTGEVCWNLPVMSCDEVNKKGVKVIIILARPANVPIIYRRIAKDCKKWGIQVFDINGTDLNNKGVNKYIFPEKKYVDKREELERKIDENDVISFDLFDTLLMRQVMYPTDIFAIVENKAKEMGIIQELEFYKERIVAEQQLYLMMNPTLEDIYERMVLNGGLSVHNAKQLMWLEIAVEKEQLIAREEMKKVLETAMMKGKKICITSDMYLSKEILKEILEDKGYTYVDELLVSCEYNVSKCNGLFEILKATYPKKRILHIGDNEEADIRMAKKYGIDDQFYIPSALKMLEDSAVRELLEYTENIEDRNWIGNFMAKQFQNPFLFEETKGKINLCSCYQMGYDLVEPMMSSFLFWMMEQLEKKGVHQLLLGARDGWILKEMLDVWTMKRQLSINYKYVYTSRLICTLAGVENTDDVLYAASLAFSGTIEEMLAIRFMLAPHEILKRIEGESDEQYLMRHIEIILQNAKKYKKAYRRYFQNIGIDFNAEIGFFDFVSSGTCQLWLEHIIQSKINGFYFMRIFDEKKSGLTVYDFFQQACVYANDTYRIANNYFFMENIVSSPEPTLRNLDQNDELIFEQESRSKKQVDDMLDIQKGILDAFKRRLEMDERGVSKEMADVVLNFVRKEYSIVQMDYFEDNFLKDEFCNREFELMAMVR